MAITVSALQASWKKSDKEICQSIRMVLAAADMTYDDIGRMMGISGQTVSDRMKRPSEIKIREWRVIEHIAAVHHVKLLWSFDKTER